MVWDDGHESFIYPGPEAIMLPPGTGDTEDLEDLRDTARVPQARSGVGEDGERVGRHDPVERIMRSPVRAVDAASTLRSAAELLAEADVGALVVNRNGVPVGILSERNIVRALAGGGDPDEVWSADMIGVDADDIVWASPSDPILQVAELMRRHHVRHVPLRARSQPAVVGIVSARDVLAVLYDNG